VLAFADAISAANAQRFGAFGERQRVPCISAWAIFAQRGNLMTYGRTSRRATRGSRPTSTACSRAAGSPTCRSSSRARSSWSSTGAPRRISASRLPPALLARANQILD
jgi:hypothetical protein